MEKSVSFPLVMKTTTVITLALTAGFVWLYRYFPAGWILSAAISAGTTCYHFAMRLVVGTIVPYWVKNPMKYRWFQQKPFEAKFYAALKVKHWKDRMPTYDPKAFDPKYHTWDEIAQATCQAETVHEVIILLSFLPLLAAIPFGSFGVFLLTSLAAALYDLTFVIMQRYNRPRIIRLIEKERTVK